MRYFNNLKLEQIGQELGVTHQTVSGQIKTSLSHLQGNARKMGRVSFVWCPWKWKLKSLTQAVVYNNLMEMASVMVVLGAVGFMGCKGIQFYSSPSFDGEYLNEREGSC